MEISWLGHSCFRIRGRDVTILTDPFEDVGWGYPPLTTQADVVTVSNDHPHHAGTGSVTVKRRVLQGPGEYEIGGAMIRGLRTRGEPPAPARNTVYVIQLEELTLVHLGDLAGPLATEQLEHVKDADVLMVPVGGGCTIDAAQATEVVAQIEPKIIVPMHYGTPATEGNLPLDPVDRFCREIGAAETPPQPRLQVSVSSLPPAPMVVLLEARR